MGYIPQHPTISLLQLLWKLNVITANQYWKVQYTQQLSRTSEFGTY